MKTLYFLPILAVAAVFAVSCDPDDPVDDTISVNSVSVSPKTLTLLEGENAHLTVTVLPKDADDQAVTWSSSNSSVVSVSDGLVIGIAEGEADITVTTHDGGFTDVCHVTVAKKVVKVTGVTLDQTSLELMVDDEVTLTASVSPENADNKTITWSSDNPDVATVSEGLVKAIAPGEAVITVKTVDGEFTATCSVTVSEPVLSVEVMEFEALPEMLKARADHAVFYAGGDLVVCGGHTSGFAVESSAEYYRDGEWHLMQMTSAHDMPFYVELPDGKWLIGGGCAYGGGSGQSDYVDLYDPATHSFSSFPYLTIGRALTRGLSLGNGDVLVSGNWYEYDSIEKYSASDGAFHEVKEVSVQRHYPYMLRTSDTGAIVFGSYDIHGSALSTIYVDRLVGDPYIPELFEEWRPVGIGAGFRAENCLVGDYAKGDYRHLIALSRKDNSANGLAIALVDGEDFKILPTNIEVPLSLDGKTIYYAGPIIVDRDRKSAYMFGSDGNQQNVTCFILRIDYEPALNGGKARLTLFKTDPVESFPGAGGQSGIVLMPDGRLLVTGGIYNSNFSPYSTAIAFKPF